MQQPTFVTILFAVCGILMLLTALHLRTENKIIDQEVEHREQVARSVGFNLTFYGFIIAGIILLAVAGYYYHMMR